VGATVEAVTRFSASYWKLSAMAWMLSVRERRLPSVSN
jgi:hypothetical protein